MQENVGFESKKKGMKDRKYRVRKGVKMEAICEGLNKFRKNWDLLV